MLAPACVQSPRPQGGHFHTTVHPPHLLAQPGPYGSVGAQGTEADGTTQPTVLAPRAWLTAPIPFLPAHHLLGSTHYLILSLESAPGFPSRGPAYPSIPGPSIQFNIPFMRMLPLDFHFRVWSALWGGAWKSRS